MNSMIGYNTEREARTESRVNEIVEYTKTPRTLKEIFAHFTRRWGVSEKTVQYSVQWAVKSKRVKRGEMYEAK